jgi:mono/diheme cytochrome c family protein
MLQVRLPKENTMSFALLTLALSLLALTSSVGAADIEAGKVRVTQQCAECHRPKDWSGETTAALESLIKDIVAGKVKHSQRKLQLTPQEIADIAAYWTSGRK